MYEAADGDLAFGDIFAADWFFAAYIRRDAVALSSFSAKIGQAWREAAPSNHRDYLFAHGLQRQAILLADDCEAESIVRRRDRGRLVFAAIEPLPVGPTAREEALATGAFRQFPLPSADGFAGGIVQFQQLFAMAVDGVVPEDDPDPRVARLSTDLRQPLEMRWAAYATRRGPLTHVDNAEKLALLLSGEGDPERLERLRERAESPEEAHVEAAREVARTLGFAWEIEGSAMNDIADVYEAAAPLDESKTRLIELMRSLGSSAQRSAALLEATETAADPE